MIPDGEPLLIDGEGNRDPFLPTFYIVEDHPKIPPKFKGQSNRALVFCWPGDDAGYADFVYHYIEKYVPIPYGRNLTMSTHGTLLISPSILQFIHLPITGLVDLQDGDFIFGRDVSRANHTDANNDVLQAYVLSTFVLLSLTPSCSF